MRFAVVIGLFRDLESEELLRWIERGWIQPAPAADRDWLFEEIDIARVSLVYDLCRNLQVGEDTVPLILSLLDQVYDLRSTLKAVLDTIDKLPAELRASITAAAQSRRSRSGY